MSYRVVYGETMPAWEREFPTKQQAEAFAKKQASCGDIIYSVAKVGTTGEIRGLLTTDKATQRRMTAALLDTIIEQTEALVKTAREMATMIELEDAMNIIDLTKELEDGIPVYRKAREEMREKWGV